MRILRRCLPALALFALVFAGCASTAPPSGITTAILGFHPTDASHPEAGGTLTLRFASESISPLGFTRSTHKLFLNDTYVGKAATDVPFGLAPLTSTTQDVPVRFENAALVRQLAAASDSHATYRLESILFQTVNDDNYELKTHSEGSLDLRGTAGAAK